MGTETLNNAGLCVSCGRRNDMKANFCSTCGTSLTSQAEPVVLPKQGSTTPSFGLSARTKSLLKLGIYVLGTLILIATFIEGRRSQTVDQFLAKQISGIESSIKPGSAFGKAIEQAHLTVTYKGGKVKHLKAKTIDGSNNAGANGKNISELTIVITAYWDGKIQKDGYTEVEFVIDPQEKKLKSSRHLASNAWIDLETIDWFKVGYTVGALLAM